MNASVINLAERRAAVADPVLNQVEAYWDGLRAGRLAPMRADVSPRGLSGALSHCFILERVTPNLARFRVFGQQIGDMMGADSRGLPISTLFFAEDREILEETLFQVFNRPATARLALESPGGFGRERLTCKMSLLPLCDDFGTINRILGTLSVHGTIGRAPRRLTITGKTILDVPEGSDMKAAYLPPRAPSDLKTKDAGKVVTLRLPAN